MASTKAVPRGIRNNNPGNIDRNPANPWQGLSEDQSSDPRFCVFTDPTWGIRAIARLLISYQDKYKINTVRGIINRWAPPNENNTTAYIYTVAKAVGVQPDDKIDIHEYTAMEPIVQAIIRHENGAGPLSTPNTWYGQDVIDTALNRAGVVKKAATVAAVPVTRETVAATGTAGLGLAQLADVAPAISAALDKSQDNLTSGQWIRIAIGVATLVVAIYIAWSQVKKHKLGVVE